MMKRSLVALFSAIFSFSVCAEDKDYSNQFGRLFTTTEERVILDRLRRDDVPEDFDFSFKSEEEIKTKQLELYVQGVMIRRDGRHVVWVNGKNTMNNADLDQGVFIDVRNIRKSGPQVPVKTLTTNFSLKPGQVWLEGKDKIVEAYGYSPQVETRVSDLEKQAPVNEDIDGDESESTDEEETDSSKGGLSNIVNTFSKERRQKEIDDILSQGE